MKVLHLTLKKKWFDMIASGEKKEEYREIKMHWATRFCDGFPGTYGIDVNCQSFKDFDAIIFRNGYSGGAPLMSFKLNGITIGEGNPEWGAEPGKKYFVIKLGEKVR
jgi:hypothetical protein